MSISDHALRVVRTAISFVPSNSLLGPRRLKDLPMRLAHRPHERDFEPLRRWTVQSPTIIDVGANRGQTIESFRAVLHSPVLHAVEPNPVLADSLRRRYPDVVVHPCGLAESRGTFVLHIPRYGHTFWDTRASLDKAIAKSFLSPAHFAFFDPKRATVESVHVPVRTLDDLALIPDIVKIDAEGMEEGILRGACKTLLTHPVLLLENPSTSLASFLVTLGYEPHRAANRGFERGLGQLNTYFLAERHSDLFC